MHASRATEINVTHLQTFSCVMRTGGYAAAAKTSHLSVPSVWQHIQSLEKAYGVQLFARSGRQVVPTQAAHRLLEHAQSILTQLDSTFDLLSTEPSRQTIRIVAGARMMLEDLADPLSRFRQKHDNRLVLRHGNDRRAEELLLADDADLALALEPNQRNRSAMIHYEPAYIVEFLAIGKRSHPYFKSKANTLRELAKHSLVVGAESTHGREALDQAFHREKLSPNIVAETDNSAFTIACVAEGMGIGVLAGRQKGRLAKQLATRSLSKHLGQREIVLMWRKGRLLTEALLALIEQIQQVDRN